MKNKSVFKKDGLFEIVMPFGNGGNPEELSDDCPLCQDIKAKLRTGEAVEVDPDAEDATVH